MGLDTTHGAWRGSYSGFTRWRNKVADAAGYAVGTIEYDDGYKQDTILIDWGHVTQENLNGIWDETPKDPLLVLIAHQDCQGDIFPEQAEPLADRLQELLPKIDNKPEPFRDKTKKFIDGLRAASAAGEPLNFH